MADARMARPRGSSLSIEVLSPGRRRRRGPPWTTPRHPQAFAACRFTGSQALSHHDPDRSRRSVPTIMIGSRPSDRRRRGLRDDRPDICPHATMLAFVGGRSHSRSRSWSALTEVVEGLSAITVDVTRRRMTVIAAANAPAYAIREPVPRSRGHARRLSARPRHRTRRRGATKLVTVNVTARLRRGGASPGKPSQTRCWSRRLRRRSNWGRLLMWPCGGRIQSGRAGGAIGPSVLFERDAYDRRASTRRYLEERIAVSVIWGRQRDVDVYRPERRVRTHQRRIPNLTRWPAVNT
jgi:hypothetical protein